MIIEVQIYVDTGVYYIAALMSVFGVNFNLNNGSLAFVVVSSMGYYFDSNIALILEFNISVSIYVLYRACVEISIMPQVTSF